MIECLTAPNAFLCPRRGLRRAYWAARLTSLVRAHVNPDLGNDHLSCAPLNGWDRKEQFNIRRESGNLLLDRVQEPVDLLVQEVDVREDRADPQRVRMIEAALERARRRRAGSADHNAPIAAVAGARVKGPFRWVGGQMTRPPSSP